MMCAWMWWPTIAWFAPWYVLLPLALDAGWTSGRCPADVTRPTNEPVKQGITQQGDLLFDHRARTAYAGDDEFVFCHPDKGSVLNHKGYADTFQAVLANAGITDRVRPFHDGRHSAITHEAAAGSAPAAIQARAGHADFSTTQRYINLAGVVFRDEAVRAEARILGPWVPDSGTDSGDDVPVPVMETAE